MRKLAVVLALAALGVAAFALAGGAQGGAVAPPNTQIHGGPTGTVASRTATFHLYSTKRGKIRCRLNARPWRVCIRARQGYVTFRDLQRGKTHTLRAQAVDLQGRRDPTPAVRRWTVSN
jgi:hypothetical protein